MIAEELALLKEQLGIGNRYYIAGTFGTSQINIWGTCVVEADRVTGRSLGEPSALIRVVFYDLQGQRHLQERLRLHNIDLDIRCLAIDRETMRSGAGGIPKNGYRAVKLNREEIKRGRPEAPGLETLMGDICRDASVIGMLGTGAGGKGSGAGAAKEVPYLLREIVGGREIPVVYHVTLSEIQSPDGRASNGCICHYVGEALENGVLDSIILTFNYGPSFVNAMSMGRELETYGKIRGTPLGESPYAPWNAWFANLFFRLFFPIGLPHSQYDAADVKSKLLTSRSIVLIDTVSYTHLTLPTTERV